MVLESAMVTLIKILIFYVFLKPFFISTNKQLDVVVKLTVKPCREGHGEFRLDGQSPQNVSRGSFKNP